MAAGAASVDPTKRRETKASEIVDVAHVRHRPCWLMLLPPVAERSILFFDRGTWTWQSGSGPKPVVINPGREKSAT